MTIETALSEEELSAIAATYYCGECPSTHNDDLIPEGARPAVVIGKVKYPQPSLEVVVSNLRGDFRLACDTLVEDALFPDNIESEQRAWSGGIEDGVVTFCQPHEVGCPRRDRAVAQVGEEVFKEMTLRLFKGEHWPIGAWVGSIFHVRNSVAPTLLDLVESRSTGDKLSVVGLVLDIFKADRKVRDVGILASDLAGMNVTSEARANAAYKLRRAQAKASLARLRLEQHYHD